VFRQNEPPSCSRRSSEPGARRARIGDRIETDIAGAPGLGWDSLLVLTGITQREDLPGSRIVPTFVGDDLSALFAPAAR
jgi:ribonucleotide monophosphatase NagD (HAD superfamily)